jgi:hypothetical protein
MRGAFPNRALQTTHLLRHPPLTGGSVVDLQIAATITANGIGRIYTFTGDDFRLFSELMVVTRVCFGAKNYVSQGLLP